VTKGLSRRGIREVDLHLYSVEGVEGVGEGHDEWVSAPAFITIATALSRAPCTAR